MTPHDHVRASDIAARLDRLYEFERAPVTPDKLHDGRYFAALFAGEHIAGTEFVIGALFVQWGAGARDLVLGLALGNLLAVLSWAFICAPIAVRVRLTLYWYVRRIIGPGLTVVYNFVNAVLYCCLAAAMIGVSASAVLMAVNRTFGPLGVSLEHPELTDLYPNSLGWAVTVLLVGSVVVLLAIAGFKKLSQFAAVCSPWMFPIFIAGALASLPKLGEFRTAGDFWRLAGTQIWTGQPLQARASVDEGFAAALDRGEVTPPLRSALGELGLGTKRIILGMDATVRVIERGRVWEVADGEAVYVVRIRENQLRFAERLAAPLGFWHIVFFAWFCNLAMHIGLSDMAVLRYARHWSYGFYSAFGMFLGHYVAWMCAGIMGAVVWGELNPGKMAEGAIGTAGLLCVLLAGWTTANPTLYRAGLALQVLTPNWPRWTVTLVAGAITTFVALFPAIFMQLLDFVAIYGLLLMPIGAVIVVEHWILPKLSLRQYMAERRGLFINPAALVAWLTVLVLCFPIEKFTGNAVRCPMEILGVHLFFRWLPGWFVAAGIYVVLSFLWGERGAAEPIVAAGAAPATPSAVAAAAPLPAWAWVAGAVAALALAACVLLPVPLFFTASDSVAFEATLASLKSRLLIATVVYFVAATLWVSQREKRRARA